VVRTRVGYSGGTTSDPTYHRLGDHSETTEIDYDPRVLAYEDLVAVFLASHSPTHPAYSTQYRSAVFYRTDEERAIAAGAIERAQASLGRIFTDVEAFTAFWRAEDYHQKYRLRAHRDLMAEFRAMFPADHDFVDSTAAARINGWLEGCGDRAQIERELPKSGLSQAAQDEVRAHALPRDRTLRR
jgi:peptide-methionine (S)-S-oxide reductase